MIFNTYIINLKRSPDRLKRTIDELSKANIMQFEHFLAVDGSSVHRKSHEISSLCQMFCTNEIIGCALSHITLAKMFHNLNEEFCLVLEDDIRILNYKTFKDHVIDLYNKFKHKDIIRLFCQGICNENSGLFAGSTAAYILTKKGASIIKDYKISYHIDIQYFLLDVQNFNIISTYDNEVEYFNPIENISVFNQKIGFWANQTCCELFSFKIKFRLVLIIIILVVLINIYNSVWNIN